MKDAHEEDDDGVTVDWIVLNAAALGLAVVIFASIQAGSDGLVAHLGDYLSSNVTQQAALR